MPRSTRPVGRLMLDTPTPFTGSAKTARRSVCAVEDAQAVFTWRCATNPASRAGGRSGPRPAVGAARRPVRPGSDAGVADAVTTTGAGHQPASRTAALVGALAAADRGNTDDPRDRAAHRGVADARTASSPAAATTSPVRSGLNEIETLTGD